MAVYGGIDLHSNNCVLALIGGDSPRGWTRKREPQT